MERLLSCTCGSQIVITPAQAGSEVTCSKCGTRLQVPTLRGLANLPASNQIASSSDDKALSEAVWRWRGPLLAICAGILMIASVSAFYFFGNWYSVDISQNVETHIAAVGEAIQRSGPDELLQVWDEYTTLSLKFPMPPPYKQVKDWAEKNLRNGQISLLVCLVMLISFLLLWRGGKAAQRKKLARSSPS